MMRTFGQVKVSARIPVGRDRMLELALTQLAIAELEEIIPNG
jgi:hypothetical protein